MKIYISGSTGFIGNNLVKALALHYQIVALTRSGESNDNAINICSDKGLEYLRQALQPNDVLIHLAGLAHVQNRNHKKMQHAFTEANINLTRSIALIAANAKIDRFILMSSVKAAAEESSNKSLINHQYAYTGLDPYGFSKRHAECELIKAAELSSMSYTIIRPPLVYGPGVKANFKDILTALSKNIPLPLGALNFNKRSMVGIDNLIHLITVCITHPNAKNQIFMVSDDHDVSTAELINYLRTALGSRSWVISMPPKILKLLLSLIGKQQVFQKLASSLRVDITHTKERLSWRPPFTLDKGLQIATQHFIDSQ